MLFDIKFTLYAEPVKELSPEKDLDVKILEQMQRDRDAQYAAQRLTNFGKLKTATCLQTTKMGASTATTTSTRTARTTIVLMRRFHS